MDEICKGLEELVSDSVLCSMTDEEIDIAISIIEEYMEAKTKLEDYLSHIINRHSDATRYN